MTKYLYLTGLLVILCSGDIGAQTRALNYKVINQHVNQMLFDTASGHILMSIPSLDAVNGNAIGFFHPDSATLSSSYYVGSEPGPIARTDNGKYLYIGCDGSANVKKFDLAAKTIVQTFSLGSLLFRGTRRAANISCQPGNDSTVAVAMWAPSSNAGVAVYRNGQKLADTISDFNDDINFVHFYDTSVLYGLNNENSGNDFFALAVNANGVKKVSGTRYLTDGSADFHINGNLATFDRGKVLDLSTSPPSVYGSYNLSTAWGGMPFKACYDKAEGLWCFAQRGFWTDSIYIQRFRASNFLPKDVLVVGKMGSGGPSSGSVNNMIYLGDSSRYAISTQNGQLVIINGYKTAITPPPAEVFSRASASDVKIYPNPVSDIVHIDSKVPVNVQLYNSLGVLVLKHERAKSFSIAHLADAVYFLRITDDAGQVVSVRKLRK